MAQWKDIKGYEGLYQISNDGVVYSLPNNKSKRGKILKPGKRGRKGAMYEFVILSDGKTQKHHSIHRLVAEAFISNPKNYGVINHKDKNTLNNNVENLEWCDTKYNNEYSHNKKVSQLNGENLVCVYKSVTEASKQTKINKKSIYNVLNGWSYTAGGYNWKYCV